MELLILSSPSQGQSKETRIMDNNLNHMQLEHISLEAFLEMDTGYLSQIYFNQENDGSIHDELFEQGFLIPTQVIN
jgi:hypothetical protein